MLLPNLKVLELAVYALPVLKEWHPILTKAAEIEDEWCRGIAEVLQAMMTANCAPKLTAIDLRLINRAPGFTASQLTAAEYQGRSIIRIRHTQIQWRTELVDSGTLVVARNVTANKRAHPVFDYFGAGL